MDRKPGAWLNTKIGPNEVPMPGVLDSDWIKELAKRALLTPAALGPEGVRELAASVISHLAMEGR